MFRIALNVSPVWGSSTLHGAAARRRSFPCRSGTSK
jgi:hypothetical protein